MNSERISDDIPHQMKILNMVIPILMCFYNLVSNWSVASCIKPLKGVRHPTKKTISDSISQDILSQIFDLSNQMLRYKSKCVRMYIFYLQVSIGDTILNHENICRFADIVFPLLGDHLFYLKWLILIK